MSLDAVRVAALPGLPLLGNLLAFRRDRLAFHLACMRAGDIVSFHLLHRKLWCVSSPELAAEVLVEKEASFVKGPALSVYARMLVGDGLLTSEGDDHRRNRRLLAPAFAAERIAAYRDVITGLAERHAGRWRDGQVVDLAEEMRTLTLAVVGRTLFDTDVEGDARRIGDALGRAMAFMADSRVLPLPVSWPLPRNRRLRTAVAELDDVVYRIIAARRAAPSDRGDVLSTLLAARDDDGAGLDDRGVRDEIMTLLLAGHETTANALAWTWYLLALHGDAYDAVCAEADAPGPQAAAADAPRLSWARQVIEEALRLYPPAAVVSRLARVPTAVGPVTVQPGEVVLVTIRGIHRQPGLWPEPEAFRPGRFTAEAARTRPRCAYLPFGAGPRVCIGLHFAMMEMQLIVAALARRWRFQLLHPGTPIMEEQLLTLRPRGGVPARVLAR